MFFRPGRALSIGIEGHSACSWVMHQQVLHQTLAQPDSSKTYVAIVRGSGGAFVGKGWFTVRFFFHGIARFMCIFRETLPVEVSKYEESRSFFL